MILRTKLEPLDGISFACEWATTIDKHWTHSSAFLPRFGFSMSDWSPVNISNAFGILRAPRQTFTLRIWWTSMGVISLSSFWNCKLYNYWITKFDSQNNYFIFKNQFVSLPKLLVYSKRSLIMAKSLLENHSPILCTTNAPQIAWSSVSSSAWTVSIDPSSLSIGLRWPADCPAGSR